MAKTFDRQALAKKIVSYVRDDHNYRNINLDRSEVAGYLGITNPMFTSIVHRELDTTFKDLVNKYRVQFAHRLLLSEDSDASLEDIAIRSGFSNRMTMHRAFIKVYGMSPGKIRTTKNKE